MTTTHASPLTETQRRLAFTELVASQNAGASVCQSREGVARQFNIDPDDLPAIEQEGVDKGWLQER